MATALPSTVAGGPALYAQSAAKRPHDSSMMSTSITPAADSNQAPASLLPNLHISAPSTPLATQLYIGTASDSKSAAVIPPSSQLETGTSLNPYCVRIRRLSYIILALTAGYLLIDMSWTLGTGAADAAGIRSAWYESFGLSSTGITLNVSITTASFFSSLLLSALLSSAAAWAWSASGKGADVALLVLHSLVMQWAVLAAMTLGMASLHAYVWCAMVVARRIYWQLILLCAANEDAPIRVLKSAVVLLLVLVAVLLVAADHAVEHHAAYTVSHILCIAYDAIRSVKLDTTTFAGVATFLLVLVTVFVAIEERRLLHMITKQYVGHARILRGISRASIASQILWACQMLGAPIAIIWIDWAGLERCIPVIHATSGFVELLANVALPVCAMHCISGAQQQMAALKAQLQVAENHVVLVEQASATRRAFVAYIAHELRNPLQTLRLGIDDLSSQGDHHTREALQMMETAGERMGQLLDSMLALDKLEAGLFTIDVYPMRLKMLVDEVAGAAKLRARTAQVAFSVKYGHVPSLVLGDYNHVVQVLSNLISNAFKFLPTDGTGRISLEVAEICERRMHAAPLEKEAMLPSFPSMSIGPVQKDYRSWRANSTTWRSLFRRSNSYKVHPSDDQISLSRYSSNGKMTPTAARSERHDSVVGVASTSPTEGAASAIAVPKQELPHIAWLPFDPRANTKYKVRLQVPQTGASRSSNNPYGDAGNAVHPTSSVAWLRFSVRDNGKGISEEDQKTLFQPFVQIDAALAQRGKGTGLGLYICKEIVTRLGGNIGVSSSVGEGSCFWFDLPMRILEAHVSQKSSCVNDAPTDGTDWTASDAVQIDHHSELHFQCGGIPSQNALMDFIDGNVQGHTTTDSSYVPITATHAAANSTDGVMTPSEVKVLLVDDDATQRLLMKRLMQRCLPQCGFWEADSGENALVLTRDAPSVILLDFHMPGMNGAVTCKRIRDAGYRGFILGVTGGDDIESKEFVAAGADAVLIKPVSARELKQRLHFLISAV